MSSRGAGVGLLGTAGVLVLAAAAAWGTAPSASAAAAPTITAITGATDGGTVRGVTVVQAKVRGATDAVTFTLSGPSSDVWTERSAPYFFHGDHNGAATGWDTNRIADGRYTLTVRAARGAAATTRTVIFTVDNRSGAPTPDPTDAAGRPSVWVLSDMSVPGGGTDRDDIVTLAALSAYADKFAVERVVVGATTVGINCAKALDYARTSFGAHLPGITLASTCADGDGFTTCTAANPWLRQPPATVEALVASIRAGGLTVLNWGPMSEIAGAVCWLEHHAPADLAKVRIVSHWTDPSPGYPSGGQAYNCAKDQSACDYLHQAARRAANRISLVELGGSGQRFVDEADDRCAADTSIPNSGLGALLNVTKDAGTPDMSDGATFLLLVTGGLEGYADDGTDDVNFTKGFQQLCVAAPAIFDHLRAHLN
ncbi:hypothetical protein ACN27B_29125 [Micromonospora sp. WMMD754]|uniref:hypothetical protein n=1 Tax=Micromonospora sp. WMMD754 TaxID=3404114 RepID=UPI003BF55E82